MASFNKIIIVGHLGRDPELRYTSGGTAVCDLNVATSEKRKDIAGESSEVTTWFRVSVWGKQAELANQYLTKGNLVYLEGRLRQEEYMDREGNKRTSLKVHATDMQFIGSRSDEHSSSSPKSTHATQGQESTSQTPPAQGPGEDDIPF